MSSADRLLSESDFLYFACQNISAPANSIARPAAINALVVEVKIIFLSK
jgi:hypothetical protein